MAPGKEKASVWEKIKGLFGAPPEGVPRAGLHESALWYDTNVSDFQDKAKTVGVLATENEDVRSLRELLILGLKGVAAYADHAAVLGVEKEEIYAHLLDALAATTQELSVDEMVAMVMKTGEIAVTTMAALDEANTGAYGHPEISEVNIGVGENPGILISGHDLKDMEELLKQTEGTGIDVYTHGEMLPVLFLPEIRFSIKYGRTLAYGKPAYPAALGRIREKAGTGSLTPLRSSSPTG